MQKIYDRKSEKFNLQFCFENTTNDFQFTLFQQLILYSNCHTDYGTLIGIKQRSLLGRCDNGDNTTMLKIREIFCWTRFMPRLFFIGIQTTSKRTTLLVEWIRFGFGVSLSPNILSICFLFFLCFLLILMENQKKKNIGREKRVDFLLFSPFMP